MTNHLTIHLNDDVENRFDALSKSMRRNKSTLVAEALRALVDIHGWQISEIQAGINEANANDFADDPDVAAFVTKWQVSGKTDVS